MDTFSKAAIARFIEITHKVYKDKVGDKFGTVIPSIFTDEPQFAHKTQLRDGRQRQDVFLPWSLDILETFEQQYNYDLLDGLLEVVWNLPIQSRPSITRYHYHDHVCERFVEGFMDQISSWCKESGIFLIGHIMKEPFLWSQTDAVGEAMRCYRNLDVPGVDILCDRFEYNTVKQAVSVARQNGGRGAMSELYGVTNWTFDFEGHKGSGDWQAALGITFRVPHLTWASMAGEAKRDYPASIGYQSPWFKEYSYIEDYFARLNVVLTRGRPVTRIGVIHSIESYWLCRGPVQESFEEQNFREQAFADLTKWFLHGLLDFDFISESLLPDQTSTNSVNEVNGGNKPKTLLVGACEYEVVILPNLKTIRSSTLKTLKQFASSGGKILVAGESPTLVDATIPKDIGDLQIDGADKIAFTETDLLREVEDLRDLRIIDTNGKRSTQFLYQMRQDGPQRFVFICNTERKTGRFTVPTVMLSVKGLWETEMLDPFTGREIGLASTVSPCGHWTSIEYRFDGCSSLLLRLSPRSMNPSLDQPLSLARDYREDSDVILKSVDMSEPNILLLDYAEWRLKVDDSWHHMEEVLRIDNIVRRELGMPLKLEAYRQPWSIPEDKRKPVETLELRFRFFSEFDIVESMSLAMEDPEPKVITLNRKLLSSNSDGWWVDKAIRRIRLAKRSIKKGENVLSISIPFGLLTNVERVYLLGDFSVDLRGRHAKLRSQSEPLAFGDWTRQGLPFYAGNIMYRCSITVPSPAQPVALCIPKFSAPLMSVVVDGVRVGNIAFEPHILELGALAAGEHEVVITAFGNRFNAFGHLHLPEGTSPWCGPLLWRTEDDWWTPEYSIVRMGVLQTPRMLVRGTSKAAFWKEGPTY